MPIPPLPATTILLVEVGSTAHGTGIPGGEDHDELGVVVETLTTDESLPSGPDRARIDTWLIDTHRRIWDRTAADPGTRAEQ